MARPWPWPPGYVPYSASTSFIDQSFAYYAYHTLFAAKRSSLQAFGRLAVDKAQEALEQGGSALVRAYIRKLWHAAALPKPYPPIPQMNRSIASSKTNRTPWREG